MEDRQTENCDGQWQHLGVEAGRTFPHDIQEKMLDPGKIICEQNEWARTHLYEPFAPPISAQQAEYVGPKLPSLPPPTQLQELSQYQYHLPCTEEKKSGQSETNIAELPAPPSPNPEPRPLTPADHRVRISAAINIEDETERAEALIDALRGCCSELEAAEEDHYRATERLTVARELFDRATGALAGYSKAIEPKEGKVLKRGRKRKGEDTASEDAEYFATTFAPPKEGPLMPPVAAVSGGGLTAEQVKVHKDMFYKKLCGKSYAELESFTPASNLANLKNRDQLAQWAFVVDNWDRGAEGMDVLEFRRKHKAFYTRMKVSKENIGRRTGHHLRLLAGGEGKKVLCRYGKSGESLMYIPLEDLYDAIFEVHSLQGHRGTHSAKKLANLKYANLPEDQIKAFILTCPHCNRRKTKKAKIGEETVTAEEELSTLSND